MKRPVRLRSACLLVVAALAGCATTDRVVLLPDDITGKVGKLHVVGRSGGETLLDSAYQEARAGGGQVKSDQLDDAAVKRDFGTLLAALPPRPKTFELYFLNDSDRLTPESRALLPTILQEVAQRPAPEVVVIGHADRVGTERYNDRLSLERAEAVRSQLVAYGFDAAHIEVTGRGDRDPLVPTAAVPEPRNRRVEIKVR